MPDGSTPLVKLGDPVPEGALLKTPADSRLTLLFANGAVLILQPRSELLVAHFDSTETINLQRNSPQRPSPEKSNSSTGLELHSGLMMLDVPPLKPQSRFEITTPLGFAGIRGTRLYVLAEKKRAAVGVAEGLVLATSLIGQTEALRPGQAIGLAATGLATATAAEIALIQQLDAAYGTTRQPATPAGQTAPKSRAGYTVSE